MTAPFTVGLSLYVWSFFLWSFRIWYKAMSCTCYNFSPLFLLHWFSQVVTNFTFTSETYVILLIFKFLLSNAAKKLLVKNVEHKVENVFFDGMRGDVQLGRFILLSVPTSQQLPRLTSLYFFTFLKWPLELDCIFPWQQSGGSEQLLTPEGWKLLPYK